MAKKINVSEKVLAARRELKNEKGLSPSLKTTMEGVLDLVVVLANRLGLDSSNSSKPPSSDLNRAKKTRTTKGKRRKPGGQKGHSGSRLEPIENPTVIEELLIDRRTLPAGKWESAGFDKRQVFDIEVSFSVTEYQAEVLKNELGDMFVAEFPGGITEPAQYGVSVKATAVYLSQYQLIPQARVQDLFSTQYGLPISKGSVNNFNIVAARTLRDWDFKGWLNDQLVASSVLHADETSLLPTSTFCRNLVRLFHLDLLCSPRGLSQSH